MKKLLYGAALILPLAMAAANADAFWHRDVHHNAEANAATVNEACNQAAQPLQKDMKQGKPCKKCDKHDMKAMKKMQKRSPEHWLAKENAEINEDYNEAVYKIGKTSLPQDAKDLLLSQAQANKELALKQAKEKSDLMMKNMEAREKFRDQIMQEKRNSKAVREMILADDEAGRRVALAKLLPMQRSDFEGLFKAMQGHPVTVRLLDPPLHEFVPHFEKEQRELAKDMNVPYEKITAKVELLAEVNPMLGHRGCRLGNTYPEITEMQPRAIIEAAMNVKKTGIPVHVEIMVPLVGNHKELRYQKNIIDQTAEKVFSERNDRLEYMIGTMIEVPRAAVTAHQIAEVAEFFSFGTNDLTQMTLGFSRDDIAKFLPIYLEKGILKNDPFQILDRNGVGQLIREAVFKGRGTRENLKCGICGEHGGEPSSVEFCHYAGLNYVSCSPYRVPIARLAAAHAALKEA